MAKELFTIGYSGYPDINDFIRDLKYYGIQVLIDVRSVPLASAYFESYNKDRLSDKLRENGIYYLNYAKQFGARQENTAFYKPFEINGQSVYKLDFETFAQSEQFLDGVQRVERSQAVIAFMCAEKHPSECHRTILVSRAFSDRGHEITHIEPEKVTSTQKDVEHSLVEEFFPNRGQLSLFDTDFKTESELIPAAYREQNKKIGFKLEDLRR